MGDNEESKGLTDAIRKSVVGKFSSLLSEENMSGLLKDVRRDIVKYLLKQTERTRDEVYEIVSKEFRDYLESGRGKEDFKAALDGYELDIRAKISMVPKVAEGDLSADVLVESEGDYQRDSRDEPGEDG